MRKRVSELVHRRLVDDPAWRAVLVANPRAAVGELLGTELAESVTVTLLQDTPNEIHLVLPSDELDLTDLDSVGGGLRGPIRPKPGIIDFGGE